MSTTGGLHTVESMRIRVRHVASLAALATILTVMLAMLAPSPATATSLSSAVPVTYTGWVYLVETHDCNRGLPTMMACGASHAPAWRWSGQAWSQTSIARAQYVYVYPYTGQWRWVWTQRTGWLAVSGEQFIYQFGYAS